eukprot:TRINITY_DN56867_c0_g1_i1.p1 TRINITY_DN56867_c0_g1~~TRINITY_DN56867_c0_g1_i1.p1  ORF type:complete len:437 (+),score=64.65 TRINITY_DN56867_c0_g1_i1:55-1365(+)
MMHRRMSKKSLTHLSLPSPGSPTSHAPPRLDMRHIMSDLSPGDGRMTRQLSLPSSSSRVNQQASNFSTPKIGKSISSGHLSSASTSPSNSGLQHADVFRVKTTGHNGMVIRRTSSGMERRGSCPSVGERASPRVDAIENLRSAMNMRETGGLRLAIEIARCDGVEGQLMTEAQHLLVQLESQRMLASAIRSKDVGRLEDAMEKAANADVNKQLLQQASSHLAQLKMAESASSHTSNPAQGEALEQLRRAVDMRETGALRLAIHCAEDQGDQTQALAETLKTAKHVLSVLECEWLLATAIRSNDRSKLQEAISKMEGLNLEQPPVVVEHAKMLLSQILAREALSTAMVNKDLQELSSALERARLNGVEKSKLDKAEQILAQVSARAELSAAMAEPAIDVDVLSRAVSKAKLLRVERREVERAELLLRGPRMCRRASY